MKPRTPASHVRHTRTCREGMAVRGRVKSLRGVWAPNVALGAGSVQPLAIAFTGMDGRNRCRLAEVVVVSPPAHAERDTGGGHVGPFACKSKRSDSDWTGLAWTQQLAKHDTHTTRNAAMHHRRTYTPEFG